MSSAPGRLSSWLAAVADLVWPLACGGCALPGVRWCPDCAASLDGKARSTAPRPAPPGLPPIWAMAAYAGPVRRAIVSWKDEGRTDLTGPLAAALGEAVQAAWSELAELRAPGGPTCWLVPMPSRRAARRARGGEPMRDLALRVAAQARRAGRPAWVLPALAHGRAVSDQAGLDAGARWANLSGAFVVRRTALAPLAAAPCLLVDDVVTTGATLAEAAEAIRAAGGHPIGAAVVAATQRRGGERVGSE